MGLTNQLRRRRVENEGCLLFLAGYSLSAIRHFFHFDVRSINLLDRVHAGGFVLQTAGKVM